MHCKNTKKKQNRHKTGQKRWKKTQKPPKSRKQNCLHTRALQTTVFSKRRNSLRLYGAPTDPLRTPFGRSSVEGRRGAVGEP